MLLGSSIIVISCSSKGPEHIAKDRCIAKDLQTLQMQQMFVYGTQKKEDIGFLGILEMSNCSQMAPTWGTVMAQWSMKSNFGGRRKHGLAEAWEGASQPEVYVGSQAETA